MQPEITLAILIFVVLIIIIVKMFLKNMYMKLFTYAITPKNMPTSIAFGKMKVDISQKLQGGGIANILP